MTEQSFGGYDAQPSTDKESEATAPVKSWMDAPPSRSLLAELAEEAQKDIERFVEYKIEGRFGWSARFSTAIDADDVKRYQRNAQGRKKRPEDADAMIANGQPLVERNVGIFKEGVQVFGSDETPLTFADPEFHRMVGSDTAVGALRKFLGDGQLLSMGGSLFREAGYGEDLQPLDPTES